MADLKNCCNDNIFKNYCSECGCCLINRINEKKEYDLKLLKDILSKCISDTSEYRISTDSIDVYYTSKTMRYDIGQIIRCIKTYKVNDKIYYCTFISGGYQNKSLKKTDEFYKELNNIKDIMNRNNWCFYFTEVDYTKDNINLFLKTELDNIDLSVIDIDKLYDSEFMLEGIKFKVLSSKSYESLQYFKNIRNHYGNLKKYFNKNDDKNNLLTLLGINTD